MFSVKNNMAKNLIISFIVSIAFSIQADAAPEISQISGAVVDNQTIVISGKGFGGKSPAQPLIWADFENGSTAPSSLGLFGGYERLQNFSLTNEGQDNNSNFSLRAVAYNGGGAESGQSAIIINKPGTTKIYAHVKRKYDHPDWWNTMLNGTVLNYKFFRTYTSPVGVRLVYPNTYYAITNSNAILRVVTEMCAGGTKQFAPNIGYLPKVQEWTTEEYELSRGNGNGVAKLWADGNLVMNYSNEYTTDPICDFSPYQDAWYSISIENYWVRNAPPAGAYVYFDDVYIDNTWARVMIGNQSTFDASNVREIQIPKAWSDSSITVTVNQGTFSKMDSLYVYVIDENGNVNSNGFPICNECPGAVPKPEIE